MLRELFVDLLYDAKEPLAELAAEQILGKLLRGLGLPPAHTYPVLSDGPLRGQFFIFFVHFLSTSSFKDFPFTYFT